MRQIEALFLRCSQLFADEGELARLKAAYPQVIPTVTDEKTYTEEQIAKAQIIVGFPKVADLPKAANLKWLQTPSSGIAPYAIKELYQHDDILITRGTGTYGRQIADHIMGMVIGFNHHMFTYREYMHEHTWKRHVPPVDLWESTILIIGLGDIGRQTALRAKAGGMRVIGIKRTLTELPAGVDELHGPEALDSLLPRADFVVIAANQTKETEGLLDARRIDLMKKGSCLINVARGSLVDQDALIAALERGHLGGAGLDVTTPEPLPPRHKLWDTPYVLITPHVSGRSKNEAHMVFDIFLENLGHYLGDRSKMRNLVDFERQY